MIFVPPENLPFARIQKSGNLPHLYKQRGTYFVTMRLFDAIIYGDEKFVEPIDNDSPEDLMGNYDPPIKLGSCWLARDKIASLVREALLFNASKRYLLMAWCIMPNHLHLVLQTLGDERLEAILRDFKGYTSRQANKVLGRGGAFWERESFDHLIRTSAGIAPFIAYTEQNPVIAGLCTRPEDWPWSSRTGRSA